MDRQYLQKEFINAVNRDNKKRLRSEYVTQIRVTTASGKTFDGCEISQNRMVKMITILNDVDTVMWILSDNTVAKVTKLELKEALKLAVMEQSKNWEIK